MLIDDFAFNKTYLDSISLSELKLVDDIFPDSNVSLLIDIFEF